RIDMMAPRTTTPAILRTSPVILSLSAAVATSVKSISSFSSHRATGRHLTHCNECPSGPTARERHSFPSPGKIVLLDPEDDQLNMAEENGRGPKMVPRPVENPSARLDLNPRP